MTYGLLRLLAERDGSSPVSPYPPPPGYDNGDTNSDFSDDSYHDDGHHDYSSSMRPSSTLSTARQGISLLPPATSLVISSTISSSSVSRTTSSPIISSTFSTSTTSRSTVSRPVAPTIAPSESLPFNDPDSIPQNEADPVLETKAGASPMGTAGIVLAAVFGFIALATIAYFLFRSRRRKQQRTTQTIEALDWNQEKDYSPGWRSTTQDTGAIFGIGRTPRNDSPRRSRYSFLNRYWYSTGSEATRSLPRSQVSSQPASPRWGALFGLGFISSPSARSVWFKSDSSEASDDQHIDETIDVQRNISQRSKGEGHARAYAHHKIRAPVRSTISSFTSRRLKRRSSNSAVSEVSDMYSGLRGSSGPTSGRSSISRDSRVVRDSMPRLPLPVIATGDRLSI